VRAVSYYGGAASAYETISTLRICVFGSRTSRPLRRTCPASSNTVHNHGPAWTGWGAGLANTRFLDQKGAGIAAADVTKTQAGGPSDSPRPNRSTRSRLSPPVASS
jgi:hypothetical protein